MLRTFRVISIAAISMCSLFTVEAAAQEKRGKNQASEEAAVWVASAGDRFILELYGSANSQVVLTTDKKTGSGQTAAKYFHITSEEAAAIVQTLVDCGMWSRPDTVPEGPHFGRYLTVRTRDMRDQKAWCLGIPSDDVTPMVIIQHLLKSSKGERQQALKDWLSHALPTEKK